MSPSLPDRINTLHVRLKAEFARADVLAFLIRGPAGFTA